MFVFPNMNMNLTCDLHPDAEVDVRVAQVSLHQDVVPLFPGRIQRV